MMPLTPKEIAFLAPTVAEYTEVRTGPAWTVLNERKIGYQSVIWLMEAYNCVDPPRLDSSSAAGGSITETLRFGQASDIVPECPWVDNEAASRRNREVEPEVQAFREARRKERTS
jgi:hypothetical protein